jgi:hypothetical protein
MTNYLGEAGVVVQATNTKEAQKKIKEELERRKRKVPELEQPKKENKQLNPQDNGEQSR